MKNSVFYQASSGVLSLISQITIVLLLEVSTCLVLHTDYKNMPLYQLGGVIMMEHSILSSNL